MRTGEKGGELLLLLLLAGWEIQDAIPLGQEEDDDDDKIPTEVFAQITFFPLFSPSMYSKANAGEDNVH